MVRLKGGKGGPHHIGKEMPFQKGDILRGGLDLGWEVSREVLVRNSEQRTVDRPSNASPLVVALSSPVLENQEGWWALKAPNTICSPWSSRRASKSGV